MQKLRNNLNHAAYHLVELIARLTPHERRDAVSGQVIDLLFTVAHPVFSPREIAEVVQRQTANFKKRQAAKQRDPQSPTAGSSSERGPQGGGSFFEDRIAARK